MDALLLNVASLLMKHEGFRSEPYLDTTGHRTVGYGHNLDASSIQYTIPLSLADAQSLLLEDIKVVLNWISKYIWWNNLTNNRKMCLIDMGFNLGQAGFAKFHNMISALEHTNYMEAARQIKASLWFTEVKHRGWEDYLLMMKG